MRLNDQVSVGFEQSKMKKDNVQSGYALDWTHIRRSANNKIAFLLFLMPRFDWFSLVHVEHVHNIESFPSRHSRRHDSCHCFFCCYLFLLFLMLCLYLFPSIPCNWQLSRIHLFVSLELPAIFGRPNEFQFIELNCKPAKLRRSIVSFIGPWNNNDFMLCQA